FDLTERELACRRRLCVPPTEIEPGEADPMWKGSAPTFGALPHRQLIVRPRLRALGFCLRVALSSAPALRPLRWVGFASCADLAATRSPFPCSADLAARRVLFVFCSAGLAAPFSRFARSVDFVATCFVLA